MTITLVTPSSDESGEPKFYLGPVERMDDGDGDWGFKLYGTDRVFIAHFVYRSEGAAQKGATLIPAAMMDAVFVATEES